MKNKTTNYLWKIVTAVILTVMLAIGVSYVTDVNGADAYAADATITDVTPEDVDYKLFKYSSITRTKDSKTGLYIDDITQPDELKGGAWLFAGWYTDATLEQHVARDVTAATDVVAKFVSADILSVKCQTSKGTTPSSPNTVLRCVSSVDSLKYNRIGFDIIQPGSDGKLDYENIPEKSDNKVGVRIYANTEKDAYTYSPKVVDTESEYFFSTTITINQDNFDDRHLIKPYWITKDGTKVYGVSRYVTVNEGLNNDIIHVAVKMAEPTVKEFAVSTPATELEYIDHDGTYAYFAIKVADRTTLDSVTKFGIFDTDDNELGTCYYRNLLTSYNGSNPDKSWYTAYKDADGEDEFVIATSADFYGMYDVAMNSDFKDSDNAITFAGYTIYLVSDITANNVTVTNNTGGTKNYTWGTQYPWTPVGSTNFKFGGIFDGQGHTIKGLYVTGSHLLGLFAITHDDSRIQKINLKDSYLSDDGTQANVFIGSVAGKGMGTFEDVYSDATIVCSKSYAGGLVGQTDGEVEYTNCHFAGNLTMGSDGQNGGGIVGHIKNAKNTVNITGSIFSGTITSDTASGGAMPLIGGICGNVEKPVDIVNCVSAGKLTTNFASVDGRIGSVVGQKTTSNCPVTITSTYVTDSELQQVGNAAAVTGATPYSGDVDLRWYDVSPTGDIIYDADDFYGVYLLSLIKGNLAGEIIRLGDNITMRGTTGTANWTPISEFAGVLDGNGYAIKGIIVENTIKEASGMFREITGATIKNLRIEDSSVTSNYVKAGAIAGEGYGTFEEVYIASSVTVTTSASGNHQVGGYVGQVNDGTTTFTRCYNGATVTSKGQNAGGFIGKINGVGCTVTITDCLNEGSIKANDKYAGGFVGCNAGSVNFNIVDSVSVGTVTAGSNASAMVGRLMSSGSVALDDTYTTISSADAVATKSTGCELLYKENADEDFVIVTDLDQDNTFSGLDPVVWLKEKGYAPQLTIFVWKNLYTGTETDPYVLSTIKEWNEFATLASTEETYKKASYKLNADIVLNTDISAANAVKWTPIPEFAGVLDGNGYAIKGIIVENTTKEASGMFREITGATIKNLRIEDSSVTSNYVKAGAIAGEGTGTFEEVYIASSVTVATSASSNHQVGGYIGQVNDGTTSFTRCYNGAAVTSGGQNAGGFIGKINGAGCTVTITDCLNEGNIHANDKYAGGFVGCNAGSVNFDIVDSVSVGTVTAGSNAGAMVGRLMSSGSVALDDTYTTSSSAAVATIASGTELLYKENADEDFVIVTDLDQDNTFSGLDPAVWLIEKGKTPVLKCFE